MGEVYVIGEWVAAEDRPTRRWRWTEPVCYAFPRGFEALLTAPPLTAREFRLLLGLLRGCDWQNRCTLTWGALGQAVGMDKAAVSRTLRRLAARQVVLVHALPGARLPSITLNPALVWKGRPWHLARARDAFLAEWRRRYAPAELPDATRPPSAHPQEGASPPRGVPAGAPADPFPEERSAEEV